MQHVIELEKVSKIYRMDAVEVPALCDVNLKIKKGEFASIIGPSGSGKSTMLHILGALDRPTSGKVIVDGTDLSKLTDSELAIMRGKKIGFVFQFFNLYPTLTARENIELPMMIIGKDKDERKKRAAELLKLVEMSERAEHYPSQLSGGERQRIGIARALANKPAFVLADEPTGNLDSKSGSHIIELLAKLNRETGVTLIIVTHDRSIAGHAKRTIVLKDGQIIEDKVKK